MLVDLFRRVLRDRSGGAVVRAQAAADAAQTAGRLERQTEAFMSGKMSNVVIDIVQNWLVQPDCPPPEEFAPWALNLWRSIMGRWKDLGDAWEHTLDHKNA